MTFKAITGYDIAAGTSAAEYDAWLFEVHAPDLLANPYLDRLVFNTVRDTVAQTSDGSTRTGGGLTFYRIAEMHFASPQAYENYRRWFQDHPIPPDRGPGGRTDFKFYVTAESTVVTRD